MKTPINLPMAYVFIHLHYGIYDSVYEKSLKNNGSYKKNEDFYTFFKVRLTRLFPLMPSNKFLARLEYFH